ncbi:MAG: hypothetical protein ABIP39_00755 [Polyangiaceae bacterium]
MDVDREKMDMPAAHRLRRLIASATLAGAALLGAACGAQGPAPSGTYLDDAAYRRSSLEASLVTRANTYSELRLSRYGVGGARAWENLPEWNPRVEIVGAGELDAAGGVNATAVLGADAHALATNGVRSEDALRALGEEAFFRYPVQLSPMFAGAASSRAEAEHYGLWVDDARGINGLVRVELADGSRSLAMTCASCHARRDGDTFIIGVGNNAQDFGLLLADSFAGLDAAHAARLAAWGPGRVDVTTTDATEPVRIPDLRPTRWLTHLHHDATVAQRDLTSLAIRLETLIITSHNQVVRPPREVALGLATYLWSLSASVEGRSPASDAEKSGAAIFTQTCAGCHAPPSFTGPPVALDVVGTDPAIGLSSDRGTGFYRVPSLHGVSTRGLLLHDASIKSVDALLDPARTIRGHRYGLDLDAPSRASLIAYLKTL